MVIINPFSDINITNLELLGAGTQGKVYKLDSERCVKVFKDKSECKEELETLIMAQGDMHFPRLYGHGKNYIIREFIKGIELDEYLKNINSSSDLHQIFFRVIQLYEAMMKIGYTRLDAAIFHVFVTPDIKLKLIDTAKAMRKKTEIPSLLISGIEKLGYKGEFFNYLKSVRPDLYTKWKNYTRIKYKKKS